MTSDSTSWLRYASFGNIMLVVNGKIKQVYVSDRNKTSPDHYLNQPTAVKEAVAEMCEKIGHGIKIEHLLEEDANGSLRLIFNLYSLDKWRREFVYKGNNSFKKELW